MSYIGKSKQLQETLDILDAGYLVQQPTILWGPPGVGKTELVRALAAKHNIPLYILLASTMDPTDINGLPAVKDITVERPQTVQEEVFDIEGKLVVDSFGNPVMKNVTVMVEEQATVTEPTLQYWSEALIREGKGILFFDEANNAVPSVQSTLLSVLQGRVVGRHTLPPSVWMIAAANETADAADAWDLSAPMANRFLHINFTPNFEDWKEGMACSWNAPAPEGVDAVELQKSRSTIVQFLSQHSTLWNAMPEAGPERSKAWPSPRTWDATARVLAVIPEERQTSRHLAVAGLVGEGPAIAFQKFIEGLRLPPYETILNTPNNIAWDTLSAGEVQIILEMVMGNLTDENVNKSIDVFEVVGEVNEKVDLVAAAVLTLHKKLHPFMSRKIVSPKRLLMLSTKYSGFLNEAGIE